MEMVEAAIASAKLILATESIMENAGDNDKLETVVDLAVSSSNIRQDEVEYSMVIMVLFD